MRIDSRASPLMEAISASAVDNAVLLRWVLLRWVLLRWVLRQWTKAPKSKKAMPVAERLLCLSPV